jgi:hypothetical protein
MSALVAPRLGRGGIFFYLGGTGPPMELTGDNRDRACLRVDVAYVLSDFKFPELLLCPVPLTRSLIVHVPHTSPRSSRLAKSPRVERWLLKSYPRHIYKKSAEALRSVI